jgi:hypothetical protein
MPDFAVASSSGDAVDANERWQNRRNASFSSILPAEAERLRHLILSRQCAIAFGNAPVDPASYLPEQRLIEQRQQRSPTSIRMHLVVCWKIRDHPAM